MEYPPQDDLFDAVGDLGITADSIVVIICKTYACFYQVMAPASFAPFNMPGCKMSASLMAAMTSGCEKRGSFPLSG